MELIYGRQPVREVLRARRRSIVRLQVREGVRGSDELEECVDTCNRRNIPVRRISRQRMAELVGGGNDQGVCLECSPYPVLPRHDVVRYLSGKASGLVLVLDRVQDPQNVGSLLRSAECAGAVLVLLCGERSAKVTPAVVRASAGASEHLRIGVVRGLAGMLGELAVEGGWSFCALEAGDTSVAWTEVDMTGRFGVVVGSEGRGVRAGVRDACRWTVRLPLRGRVGSLNAGVAGAIAMFESVRQREKAEGSAADQE